MSPEPQQETAALYSLQIENAGDATVSKMQQQTQECHSEKKVVPKTFVEWIKTGVWISIIIPFIAYVYICHHYQHKIMPSQRFAKLYQTKEEVHAAYHFPNLPSTIDYDHMVIFFSVSWFVIALISEVALPWRLHDRRSLFFQFLNLSIGCFEAMFLANATTDYIKYEMGMLRPDFHARCYGANGVKLTGDIQTSTGIINCSNPKFSTSKEGLISFPSGHTSTGMTFGLYLTLYLIWCIHFRNRSYLTKNLSSHVKIILVHAKNCLAALEFVPVYLAYAVAMTRIADFKHHKADILMGLLIASFYAIIIFARTVKQGVFL